MRLRAAGAVLTGASPLPAAAPAVSTLPAGTSGTGGVTGEYIAQTAQVVTFGQIFAVTFGVTITAAIIGYLILEVLGPQPRTDPDPDPEPDPNPDPTKEKDDQSCAKSEEAAVSILQPAATSERSRLYNNPNGAYGELSRRQRAAVVAEPWALTRRFFGTLLHENVSEDAAVKARFIYSRVGPDFTDKEYTQCQYELTTDTVGTLEDHRRKYPFLPESHFITYTAIGGSWRFVS